MDAFEEKLWRLNRRSAGGSGETGVEQLAAIIEGCERNYRPEHEQSVALPRSDAVKFWKRWWADGQAEQKK